jgi:hypothetical protein
MCLVGLPKSIPGQKDHKNKFKIYFKNSLRTQHALRTELLNYHHTELQNIGYSLSDRLLYKHLDHSITFVHLYSRHFQTPRNLINVTILHSKQFI